MNPTIKMIVGSVVIITLTACHTGTGPRFERFDLGKVRYLTPTERTSAFREQCKVRHHLELGTEAFQQCMYRKDEAFHAKYKDDNTYQYKQL